MGNLIKEISYFVNYYNCERTQKKLGDRTPVGYGTQYSNEYNYQKINCVHFKSKTKEIREFDEELYNNSKMCASI